MKQFTRLDLPAPVAPAISTCGIVARFTICDRPWMSLPRATVERMGRLLRALSERRMSPSITKSRCLFGTSMPIAELARDRRLDADVWGGERVRDVAGQVQDLVHLGAATRPRPRTS